MDRPRRWILAGRLVMTGGLGIGLAYAIWLAYDHQSNPNDAKLLITFAVFVELPVAVLLTLPAQLLLGRICRSAGAGKRLLLGALAATLPAAACLGVIIAQGPDWDEVFVVWIPMAPTIVVVGLFAMGLTIAPRPVAPIREDG